MQNIADFLTDVREKGKEGELKTFLTYNLRRKTISTTKRELIAGGSLLETPEGCFYDVLQNAHDLLASFCHFEVPELLSREDYIEKGAPFVFLYHPALGPTFSIIGQKLRRGRLALHSELQLDIAEMDSEDLDIQGSLKIRAEQIMGDKTAEGHIRYSVQTGKCTLKRVKVVNRGVDTEAKNCYWKNQIARKELCEIVIRGNGEFLAEDVTLQGNMRIEIEDGYRVRALQQKEKVIFLKEKITVPSWTWKYTEIDTKIVLIRCPG